MSIVAELTIPTERFALTETLAAAPEVAVEFERVVTHSQEWVMPFLWVAGAELDAFRAAIGDDPTVADFTITDRFDGVDLYQIRWSAGVRDLVNRIFDQSGVLIEANGGTDSWNIVVQFGEQRELANLKEHFESEEPAFTLDRLYTPESPRGAEFNLSATQRETLVLAIERGYFAVPRETTLAALADDLGVTSTAVSERLRRAMVTLGTNTLSVDPEIE